MYMDNYFKKYLKYKNKYLLAKNHCGGSLAFHPINHKLLRKTINDGLLSLTFQGEHDSKYTFTPEEISGLHFYSEFILPFYKKENTYIGDTSSIELLASGGFGIILRLEDIVIKILNTRCFSNDSLHEQHYKILQELRNSIIVAKLPHSDYICYTSTIVSSNNDINDKIKQLSTENIQLGKLNIHNITTQQQKFDFDALLKSVRNVITEDELSRQLMPDTLVFTTASMGMFGTDAGTIFNIFSRRPTFNKITYLFKMSLDCLLGLNVLHSAGYVHCDIKPPNIILGQDGNFKLIDIGSMVKCDSICFPEFGYSPVFVDNSVFKFENKFRASIFFDLWCLLLSILLSLEIIKFQDNTCTYKNNLFTYDYIFGNYAEILSNIKETTAKLNITPETAGVTPTFNNFIQLLFQSYMAERNFNSETPVFIMTTKKLPATTRIEFENIAISFLNEFMGKKEIVPTEIFNLKSLPQ